MKGPRGSRSVSMVTGIRQFTPRQAPPHSVNPLCASHRLRSSLGRTSHIHCTPAPHDLLSPLPGLCQKEKGAGSFCSRLVAPRRRPQPAATGSVTGQKGVGRLREIECLVLLHHFESAGLPKSESAPHEQAPHTQTPRAPTHDDTHATSRARTNQRTPDDGGRKQMKGPAASGSKWGVDGQKQGQRANSIEQKLTSPHPTQMAARRCGVHSLMSILITTTHSFISFMSQREICSFKVQATSAQRQAGRHARLYRSIGDGGQPASPVGHAFNVVSAKGRKAIPWSVGLPKSRHRRRK